MPGRDRSPARYRSEGARGDRADDRECWPSSTHNPRAACESRSTPSCPPSRHRECSSDSLLRASFQNKKPVYLQGTSSIQTSLLTSSPCRYGCATPVVLHQRVCVGLRFASALH